ncbi:hypothetical protein LRP52_38375 [Photobacterium sp. ZSDE20]|uniref:Uncharacterized protein n=1 Tax=Photobacterium pectinilyticum TaxID=2906793 RepID=A0ABT1N775_9GAMM|nr:hypothetical protein [Photobacterium sp. ZSDE20]MCQ1060598.1 hypothetical protein [Photobacterium sp. ZSDE20]MDD1828047.1 hypothetical protein [Photobacterium sp. ZSDE20]
MKSPATKIKALTPIRPLLFTAMTVFIASFYISPLHAQDLDEILEQHNVEVMKEVATIQAQMDLLYNKDELSEEETEQLFLLENLMDEFYETLM